MKRIAPTLMRMILAVVVATALIAVTASQASADTPQQTVHWTKIGIYPRTGPSWASSRAGAAVSDGTVVTVLCEVDGEPVTSDVIANDPIWADTNIGYLPNAFLLSGYDGRTPGVADCNAAPAAAPAPVAPAPPAPAAPAAPAPVAAPPAAPAAPAPVVAPPAANSAPSSGTATAPQTAPVTPTSPSAPTPHLTAAGDGTNIQWTDAQIASSSSYNRVAVARWALAHYKTWSGKVDFGDDNCTYFVSTALSEIAGWNKDWNWNDSSFLFFNSFSMNPKFWNGPTKDYVSADYFKNWLRSSGYVDKVEDVTNDATLPSRAQVGDIIQYDFHDAKGNPTGADGTVDHTMMIVGFDDKGALVVGVSDPPPSPNAWQNGSASSPITQRYHGARIYLLHITR